ncbi:MAG: helix-turn-helix transcriptional regulator [Clostridiales bacterium]|nr:helix-turn-helix transcriptional regulator [Clostridiales bacterium]
MNTSLGKKISDYRKALGMTQDQLAEKMNVSPQAVSKWENDISCPDIALLPKLAALFGITVDALLSVETKKEIELLPEDKKKNFDDLILRVIVNSSDGDKVRVNLPMPLVKLGLEMGMSFSQVSDNDALKNIDVGQILRLVEKGVIGKLVEVESADGDIVDIVVE